MMLRILAILAFVMSIIFYAWNISHGTWTWVLWALLGAALWCASDLR